MIEGDLAQINAQIETIRDEEQEMYDNMPESFQNGERDEASQSAIDSLTSAYDGLEGIEAVGVIEEAIFNLEEAVSA